MAMAQPPPATNPVLSLEDSVTFSDDCYATFAGGALYYSTITPLGLYNHTVVKPHLFSRHPREGGINSAPA